MNARQAKKYRNTVIGCYKNIKGKYCKVVIYKPPGD